MKTEYTLIRPDRGVTMLDVREVLRNRQLIKMLAARTIKTRYRETKVGILWAFIQPLAYMLVLNTFFGMVARFETDHIPYPLHLLSGLVAFQFFTKSINEGASSISRNQGILSKVYLPRIVFPISSIISGMIDFIFPAILLVLFLFYYQIAPTANLIYLPIVLFFLLMLGTSAQLMLSVLTLRFQDFRMVIPILTQLWFFATPIFYPVSRVPDDIKFWYGLNPTVGIVEAFRYCVLGYHEPPDTSMLVASASIIIVAFFVSLVVFRTIDREIYKYL